MDRNLMPEEEVKFFRDFFNYRKGTYSPLYDTEYWEKLYYIGDVIVKTYKDTPFEQFAIDLVIAHQMDVGRRYNK